MWKTKNLNHHNEQVNISSNPKDNSYSDDFKRSFNGKMLRENHHLQQAIKAHSYHTGNDLKSKINFQAIRKIIREMMGLDTKQKSPSLIEDSSPRGNDNRQMLTDARRGVNKPSMNDFMQRRMKERERQLLNDRKEKKKDDSRQMLMG